MTVFLESPQGDEIKEVEATAEKLSPLLSQGWHQVPAPAKHESVVLAKEEK
ncbi:MAG: hypothetical protein ACLPX8_01205 [Bryobacteraceae bacterium]|jgi:hypothetical protein